MANFGFQVEEIDEAEEEEKKRRIGEFLQRVNLVMELSRVTEESLESKSNSLQEHYKNELAIIEATAEEVQKMIANLQKTLIAVRNSIVEEANSEIAKVKSTRESLRLRLKEQALLAQYLSERYSDTLDSVDLVSLDKSFSQFGESLTSTVEDCKKVFDTKSLVSKLGSQCPASVVMMEGRLLEVLRVRKQELQMKEQKTDTFSRGLERLSDIDRQMRGRMTARSSFESTSWNELHQEKNVYISFDNKNLCESGLMTGGEADDMVVSEKESLTDNYISILERIDENQNQNKMFYNSIIQRGMDQDPLFIVTSEHEDFSEKQTPELGIKDQTPEYLKQQLAQLHQQYETISLQKRPEYASIHPEKYTASSRSQENSFHRGAGPAVIPREPKRQEAAGALSTFNPVFADNHT